MVYNNERLTGDLPMKNINGYEIRDTAMNPCKKCEEVLHYPSQLHTVFDGHTCCKCLGHEYATCFNPWQRKKITYEQYKGESN